jgi:hypothetical protein
MELGEELVWRRDMEAIFAGTQSKESNVAS